VLIGPPGWGEAEFRASIRDCWCDDRVLQRGATWDLLPDWYRGASLFAFPSTAETFGLPVLEAMASGTPVVCGDIAALRETGGQAACYVNLFDEAGLADALDHIVVSELQRLRLAAAGITRAQEFTWIAAARDTWSVPCGLKRRPDTGSVSLGAPLSTEPRKRVPA